MLDLNTINILKKQGHIIRSDNTLHGFTKARIVQLVRCLENNWAAALERCENQYKILHGYHEKEKKYGWRDLRNDPENLPEDGMNIIVWNDSEAGKFSMTASPYWVRECAKYSGYNIVAWKLIEPFEQ